MGWAPGVWHLQPANLRSVPSGRDAPSKHPPTHGSSCVENTIEHKEGFSASCYMTSKGLFSTSYIARKTLKTLPEEDQSLAQQDQSLAQQLHVLKMEAEVLAPTCL